MSQPKRQCNVGAVGYYSCIRALKTGNGVTLRILSPCGGRTTEAKENQRRHSNQTVLLEHKFLLSFDLPFDTSPLLNIQSVCNDGVLDAHISNDSVG
jgi:hypothetical protein